MGKDSRWFTHDVNSIQDPKMVALLSSCGLAGVGAFWVIVEILHQQENGCITHNQFLSYLNLYGMIDESKESGTVKKISDQILKSGLLEMDGDVVFSSRANRNINFRKKRTQLAKNKASKRWSQSKVSMPEHSRGSAVAVPKLCQPNAITLHDSTEQQKKRERRTFAKPTLSEIEAYCGERKNGVNPTKFFNHYESNGWRVGKNPMRDWKAAVRTWEQNSFEDSRPEAPPLKLRNLSEIG